MKKKKLLICLLFIFLLSGCSVNYDIEIKDSNIKVNGKLVELDKNKWDDIIVDNSLGEEDVDVPIEDNEVDYSKLTFEDLVNSKTIEADEATRREGLEKLKTKDELGITYKEEYSWKNTSDFSQMAGVNTCYDHFTVLRNNDEESGKEQLIISTSAKNYCFDMYPNLESITVNVKTNHKVVSHNADQVSDGKYVWEIDKNNAEGKTLQIILSEDTVFTLNWGLIFGIGGVILVIGLIYLVIKNKSINANKI